MKKRKDRFKDMLYTIVIALAIVSLWRGFWGFMDLYLFPYNHIYSFTISILLGIVVLYFTENLREESIL